MSARFFRSDLIRKLISMVCLLAFPAAAQQSNTAVTLQVVTGSPAGNTAATDQPASSSAAQQPGAPSSDAPEPRKLPPPTHVDYSKPAPLFPNPFARFIPREVPPPVFTNAPKLAELVQSGKIMLSMNDAIAIALADNLDLVIARYNLPIADTDILRTKSGASFLGVSAGILQGTPGGGVGGIGTGVQGSGAGGTSAGAGGAGSGAGGIVGSTAGAGPQPDNFDPVLAATFSMEDQRNVTNFGLVSGIGNATLSEAHFTQGNVTYQQGFSPGTLLTVAFTNQRETANSNGFSFNPAITSGVRATLRQHLLQGFGPSLNTRFIRVAKNNKKITEEAFTLQVITTVSQIESIYWDLVNAYEDYKVKERALALQQKTLSDNKKQVEIGTLAPLDVVRAESSVASAEQDLITSKSNLQLQQLTIKNALTRTLPNNSQIIQMDVIPTDIVQIPDKEDLPPPEDLIKLAMTNRPDYIQQQINLKNSDINKQGVNNQLLPVIDVVAFYAGAGLSGVPNPTNPFSTGLPNGGFPDSFGNIFNNSAPDKGVAINIQIPLGNRFAQSQQARSRLEYLQSQLLLKQFENLIAINIRNDVFTLTQARARVAAADRAQVLAQQTLDAEQKKYNLGASTYLAILTDEIALTQATVNQVSAMTNYAKARVLLDKDTAQTLDHLNIKLDEATTGNIKTQPNVPGTVVNKNAVDELTNPGLTPPPPPESPKP